MSPIDAWHTFWTFISGLTVDDFNKLVLAIVALVALFLGPWMQWRIAKKQIQMQSDIAEKQAQMQADIAEKQAQIQSDIAKLQIETQSRIATRQIADNISSKRQNWIDELRKDAAEFLTIVGRIQELKRPRVKQLTAFTEVAEDFQERLTAEMRAKELVTRIVLRLNPKEDEHNRLVQLVFDLDSKGYKLNQSYSPSEEEQIANSFNTASNAVVEQLQTILKHEWERVKKGDV